MNESTWTKEYVADAVQPYDGFTNPRRDTTPPLRKMQVGIKSKLGRSG